jgi:uncharacterized membrane protein
MDTKKLLEILNESYKKQVKPLIEKGKYLVASLEMQNILIIMQDRKRELLGVHMASGYVASARMLYEDLKKENEKGIERSMNFFEAYSAQTRLPLIIDKS